MAPTLNHHQYVANSIKNCYSQEDEIDATKAEKLLMSNSSGSDIQKFFTGQTLFLTGATGFLGKVLIEKLLRSCGDIDSIYVLIRSKKGKDPIARLHEFMDDFIFHKAHQVNPKGIHKLIPVVGDFEKPGLGISEADRKMLASKVTIIINAAATVRFDEKLSLATTINVKGPKEMIKLAKECKKLIAFTHISTAFANTHMDFIEEKFYDPPMGIETLEALVQLDDDILEQMTPRLLGNRPNTYCFTKAIAEEAIRMYGEGMPISIVRPAIVVSTYEEPVRGWTDSVYGPTGLMVGAGTGIIRTMFVDESKVADMVPVDMTVNIILASTWHTAKNYKENETSSIPIYNFVSSAQNPITWGEFIEKNYKYGHDKPTTKAVWYYGLNPTKSYPLYLIYNFFLHFIPALLIDSYCAVTGNKRRLLKIYNRMSKLSDILHYFSLREWRWSDANVQVLWGHMSKTDQAIFPYNMKEMDWDYLIETFLVGLRVYLVKDDLSTLPEARKRWRRLFYMHMTLKIVTFSFVLYIFYLILSNFFYIIGF